MADFTQQQKAILACTARNNLVHAVAKTGKTTVLARKYLTHQQRPGTPKAIFITANALATERVVEHLQRITALSWQEELIGTFAEIGFKLLKRYHRELAYTKPPEVVSDLSASADRDAARKTALEVHADQASAAFHEQWNQAFVQIMRRKSLATPRSLTIEAINLLTKVIQPELAGVRLLLADNVHDFGLEEMLALSALQARMGQTFLAGNLNLAIYDRLQDLDPEHWLTLVHQDGIKSHPLTQLFGVGNARGLFVQQLAAYNSKRVYETALTFSTDPASQMLVEVTVATRQQMLQVILDMEAQLQLGIRRRLLAVILRNPDDTREMARNLKRPCFLQWDKNRLWHRTDVPTQGIVCTTPFEAPYLNPDYVVLPNCLNGYWPYQRERNAENCRRGFLRAVSSARNGVFFLIPDPSHALLPSPFLAEGCTPRLVTKAVTLKLGEKGETLATK
jgi:hypothetical protein